MLNDCNFCGSSEVYIEPVRREGNKAFRIKNCESCKQAEKFYIEMKMNVAGSDKKPVYANEYAAGLDLVYAGEEPINIKPDGIGKIPTRLKVEIPAGFFGMVVPRSGLGFKHRITLINDVGIIDEDYRGEIGVSLLNEGSNTYTIEPGERVAQMIIIPYIQPIIVEVEDRFKLKELDGEFLESDLDIIKKAEDNKSSFVEVGDWVALKNDSKVHEVIEHINSLSETERGIDGYGSTGKKEVKK